MSKILPAAIVLFLLSGAADGENASRIEGATAQAGQQDVSLRVLINNDVPIMAFSFAGRHAAGLTFDRLTVDGTVLAPGELEADYVETINWGDVFGAAVLIELPGSISDPYNETTLPIGTDHFVLQFLFDVDAGLAGGTALTLDLRDDLKSTANPQSPVVKPVFTRIGSSVTPILRDGVITVVAPLAITGVSPTVGPESGGTPITITGSDFTPETTVTIGGLDLAGTEFVDTATMRGTTPAHEPGTVAVTVSNALGSDTLLNAFTYEEELPDPPTIVSVVPAAGFGDVDVTIMGTNFIPGDTVVRFGGTSATETSVVSDTVLTCHSPACGAGPGGWAAVEVQTSGGTARLNEGYFCEAHVAFTRGDANQDGHLDLSDGVAVLLYLFGYIAEPDCRKAIDANDDGALNVADAVSILSYLYAGGPIPPPPHPGCGLDPTADTLSCASHPPCSR